MLAKLWPFILQPVPERSYCKGKSRKVKGKSEEEKRIFHSHLCLKLAVLAGDSWGRRPQSNRL
jgi:hypothetical protein